MKVILCLLIVLGAFLLHRDAMASHYRYGTMSWRIPDAIGAPNTVRFQVTYAIVGSSPVSLQDLTVDFGDGTNSGAIVGAVVGTATDAAGQPLEVRQFAVDHTYAVAGTYTAFFEECCRIAQLVNGANANYRVDARVVLQPGNTAGPITASPAIIQLQSGGVRTFTWPVFDADLDAFTCRFGTAAETGFPNPTPVVPDPPGPGTGGQSPALQTVQGGCQLTWDMVDAQANQRYVVHVIHEATHFGQVSSSALDVIVEIGSAPPPTCDGTDVFFVDAGQTLSTSLTGTSALPGNLTVSTLDAPPGSVVAPGGTAPSPFTNTFDWTPGAGDSGTATIVVVSYTTPQYLTGLCFVTGFVPSCANYGDACTTGVGACATNGTFVCAGPGMTLCDAAPGQPAPEVCDGLDNDCDGVTDNGDPGGGVACSSGLSGVCDLGTTSCSGGAMVCVPGIAPGSQTEVCDGLDNDCDGSTDNSLGVGDTCTVGAGQCEATGVVVCDGAGGVVCDAVPGMPAVDVCDGIDNDCDGAVDEDYAVGSPCTAGVGQCEASGSLECDAMGDVACDAVPGQPQVEICDDGLDQNCDGMADDGCEMTSSSSSSGVGGAGGEPGVGGAGASSSSAASASGGQRAADAGDDGGCGCRTTPRGTPSWLAVAAAAGALARLRRPRRRAVSSSRSSGAGSTLRSGGVKTGRAEGG